LLDVSLHNMCMNMWRTVLPEILASSDISTQEELVGALSARGHAINQATVSRELRALGVAKVNGIYRLPTAANVGAPIHAYTITGQGCLAVIKTEPAHAMVIAQAIDGAAIDGVVGTVAGDDTVFVAMTGKSASKRLGEWLGVRRARDASTR
jgi:transcriptional regulator of arginine metabolism